MEKILRYLYDGDQLESTDQEFFEYFQALEKKHREAIRKYKIWREYLKRSKKYKQVCQWISQTRIKNPFHIEAMKTQSLNENKAQEDLILFGYTYTLINLFKPPISLESYFNFVSKQLKVKIDTYEQNQVDQISESANLHPIFGIKPWNNVFRIGYGDNSTHGAYFFEWAYKSGYPFEDEMLMNYFLFGNTSNEIEFFDTFRWLLIIELQNKSNVFNFSFYESFILTTRLLHDLLKREPTVIDVIEFYNIGSKNNSDMLINIVNPHENKDKILKNISEMIDNYRNDSKHNNTKNEKSVRFQNSGRFELPGKKARIDEIEHYLMVYDQKENGKKNKELAKIFYPSYDLTDADLSATALRYVSRDLQKARKILKNVEMGYFPGNYQ